MPVFLKKAAIFLLVGLILAYLLQCIIDAGLKKSGYSLSYREWYNLYHSDINADILIQGGSRARLQISPLALERNFKLSAYNIGIDRASFPIENYMFKEYVKYNKRPRYIIHSIDVGIFNNPVEQFDYKQFIPYLNKEFLRSFKDHSIFTLNDLYIPLYKYSHSPGIVIAGLESLLNKRPPDNGRYNGFESIDHHYVATVLNKRLKDFPKGIITKDNDSVYNDFISYIKYCKKENIKLILVITPALFTFQNTLINRDSIMNVYNKTAQQYNIPFLNYSRDKMGLDTSMFFDFYHLNKKGVKVFNEKLMKDLSVYIK